MEHLTDIIQKRRSIRKYKSQIIEREKILEIIKTGMYAPSAVNKQPWHFIVIDDRRLMKKIMEIHSAAKMLATASHVILVCGDEQLQHDKGYWIADSGAVTQNLLLAATSYGLGSCWIGVYPRENRMKAISELFEMPSYIKPFAMVSLGYPDEEKEFPDRYRPDRINHNSWVNPY